MPRGYQPKQSALCNKATQQRKAGTVKFNEWSAGIGYTLFKGMETYIDLAGMDKPKKEGDAIEVGIRYSF